jgi:hypothetical protein
LCASRTCSSQQQTLASALRLPRFSPNSCPTIMQFCFSHFKNIKRFKKLTFHGGIHYFIKKLIKIKFSKQ